MEKIDYELMKIRYEMFGENVQDLALSYQVPPDMLQQEITDRGWKANNLFTPSNVAPDLASPAPTNLESFAATFTETAKAKLTVFSLARQLAFADDYARIERDLLKATITAIANLDSNDTRELKTLTTIFKELTANSVTANIGKTLQEADDKGNNIVVQILNEIKGEKSETSTQLKVQ